MTSKSLVRNRQARAARFTRSRDDRIDFMKITSEPSAHLTKTGEVGADLIAWSDRDHRPGRSAQDDIACAEQEAVLLRRASQPARRVQRVAEACAAKLPPACQRGS
jgi:hypothetical protein